MPTSTCRSVSAPEELSFLSGGGEMGELIRAFDWASTPVGPPQTWPQSLRLTVRLMLNTQHPMFIFWGDELIQFYNDGYRQTMGPEMHPAALGARGRECWADIWHIIGPQIELVMAGEGSTWNVDQLVPINRHGSRQDVWWTYSYSPIDLDNCVGGVLVVCNDVTEEHLTRQALRQRWQRMAKQFEQAPGFIAVLRGPQHTFELANAAYRRLIGGRDVIGKPVRAALPEIEGQGFFELLDEVYASGTSHVGRRTPVVLPGEPDRPPRRLYLDFVYQAIQEPDGSISGIFIEGQDVTEHVNTEARLVLVNEELRHRVKNALATIAAVANQTLREAAGPEAMAKFNARMAAFAAAHDALTGNRESVGFIADVVRSALQPHNPGSGRFHIEGPRVEINANQAQSLALSIHELATNAAKYGAISADGGRVEVVWRVEQPDAPVLHLEWREIGGPPVTPPTRKGFGSRLIQRIMAADFGGEVKLDFATDGVHMHLRAPMQNLSPASSHPPEQRSPET